MKVATIVAGSIIDQHSKVKDTEKDISVREFLKKPNAKQYVNDFLGLKTQAQQTIFWEKVKDENSVAAQALKELSLFYMDNENRYDPYYKARMDRQAIGEQIKKTKWYDIPGHLGNAGLAIGSGLNILYSNSWFDPRNYQYGDYVPEDTEKLILKML